MSVRARVRMRVCARESTPASAWRSAGYAWRSAGYAWRSAGYAWRSAGYAALRRPSCH